MLKLMKYEFRKTRTTLLAMLGALVILEAGFLIGYRMDDFRIGGVCLGLLTVLVFAVYLYILIAGIVSYSRELNDRTGYMTFMVPVSPMGVVGSKLLYTILAALAVTALFGGAAYCDYSMLFKKIEMDADSLKQMNFAFNIFAGSMGSDITLSRVILTIAFEMCSVMISIMLVMCTAYLSITLSATLLQNKKGFLRALVSIAFFVALNYLTNLVSSRLVHDNAAINSSAQLFRYLGIQGAVELGFAAAFAGSSAWLLDRKVSL